MSAAAKLAESAGLNVGGVRFDTRTPSTIVGPGMVLMRPHHYVVLYWSDRRTAVVADPAVGWLRIPIWLFSGLSTGLALVAKASAGSIP